MLLQGAQFGPGIKVSDQSHLPAKALMDTPKTHGHEEHLFHNPPNTAGHAKLKRRRICPAALGAPPQDQSTVVQAIPLTQPTEVVVKAVAPLPATLGVPPQYQSEVVQAIPSVQPDQFMPNVVAVQADQGSVQLVPLTRTSQWRHKKKEYEQSQGEVCSKRAYIRKKQYNVCKKCGQPRIKLNGHSQYKGYIFCPSFEQISREQWLAQKKMKPVEEN